MRATFIALAVLLFAVQAFADRCGGNCPSGGCPSCPCGNSAAKVDVNHWCAQYSGWNQNCCRCIMSHESGGNGHAANYNRDGTFDVGMFQINKRNWASCSGGHAPCDANTNLQCAIKVWKWGGNSFKLWSTARGCGCA